MKNCRFQMLATKLLSLVVILLTSHIVLAGELVITGVYHGTNLYIQNPQDGNQNYCIYEVYINDRKLPVVPQSTAFALDLSYLKEGDPVVIKIVHHDWAKPQIINPNAIRASEDFQFTSLNVSADQITWVAKGERKQGKYFVMKYEHNNWVVEKVLDSQGSVGNNTYEYPARHHSGLNKYKIKYLAITGKTYFSPEVEYTANVEKVTFAPKRVSNQITFSKAVRYEIRDVHGSLVKEGTGDKVDCSSLVTGVYYLSFDNQTEQFLKK